MPIDWRVLTPATASIDGRPVDLTLRQRALLLLLLAQPGQRVSMDRLADALWGDDLPKNPRNAVARFVADLRRTLGSWGDRIVTDDGGYLVVVADGELDKARALALITRARTAVATDPEEALAAIAEARSEVGDAPNHWLVELTTDHALVREHQALRAEVLDLFADLMLRTGRHLELVGHLERSVEQHPHDEGLWQHLIEAFARSGRSAEALRASQRLRRVLAEVGLEPSEVSLRIETQILTGSSQRPELGVDLDAVATAPTGRASDLRAIELALGEHRLVSIVGAAGVGKSHLASAVAADLALEGATVYRVAVRDVYDADRLVPTIASAVGVPPALAIDDAETLAQHLQPVSCVILLDDCDHLRAACAALVEPLLAAPSVTVLTSSRTPLRGTGEFVHRLGALATGDGRSPQRSPAAQLFAQSRGAPLDDPLLEIDAIEAIGRSLQGHPGAIRVAAGMSTASSEEAVLQALTATAADTSLAPMDRVLQVAWSELATADQNLLARLSVFRGGCTAGAAAAVCTDGAEPIDDQLGRLEARGVLQRTAGRYVLDEAVRDFAADRLSDRRETHAVMSRLVDWLRSLTEPWGIPEIGAYADVGVLLLPEHANLTAALTFLQREGKDEELAWLALRTAGMWINHGRCTEMVRWLAPLAEDQDVSTSARSAIAACLLEADLTVGRYANLAGWGNLCLELADGEDFDWVPMVAGFFAMVSLLTPMAMTTEEYFDLAQRTADRSDSQRTNQAFVYLRRAQVAHHRRSHDEAVALFRRGLALISEPGRLLLALEMGETISLYNGGRRAEALESVGRWTSSVETDEWHYQVDIIRAIVVGGTGNPDEATRDLAEALRRHAPISVWARADEFQMAFGLLAAMRGEHKLADELLATPLSGSPFLTSMVIEHLLTSRNLGPDDYEAVATEVRTRQGIVTDARDIGTGPYGLETWWSTGERKRRSPA